jgi:hypothetical protein
LSKIVVVVRNKESLAGTFMETEKKGYDNAHALNNERGELIINRITKTTPDHTQVETIAVFKEWLYWEQVE